MSPATVSVLVEALAGLTGAVDVEPTGAGRVPLRLSRQSLAVGVEPVVAALARMPAGMRLRVRTDAPWLELSGTLTLVKTAAGIQPACFEVATGGVSTVTVTASEGNIVTLAGSDGLGAYAPGGPTVIRFPLGETGLIESHEIWLPHAAQIAIDDIVIPAGATLIADPDGEPRWIHHGSSISHCFGAVRPSVAWPALAALDLGFSLTNLGFAGQCHLDQFVARTIRDAPAELISLEVGINIIGADSMRERVFVSSVHGFLDTVREGHPETPVVLISPILCPVVETEPGPLVMGHDKVARGTSSGDGALSAQRVRHLLEVAVRLRRENGDRNIFALNGLDIFGEADEPLLADGLHPAPAAWPFMGRRAAELIRRLGLGRPEAVPRDPGQTSTG